MLGSVLGLLLAAGPTEELPNIDLAWEAPSECPSLADVRAKIDALVGAEADLRASGYVVVKARVTAEGGAWAMDFRIETATGGRARRWTASTCEALAEIAAVVTAVTIDSGLAEEASDEASTEEAAPVPEPPKDAAPEPEPPHDAPPPHIDVRTAERERVRSKSTPPEGAIMVAGAMEAGALPGVTGGGSGSLALIWPHARWELGASGFAPRMQPVPDTSARARIDLWHVETRACGVPEVGRVAFPLCGGVQAGVMTGRSRGVANRDDRRLPWLAFEASAGIVVRATSWLGVVAAARLVVPALRPGFEIDARVVHRAAGAAFLGIVGLEGRWRWPGRRRSAVGQNPASPAAARDPAAPQSFSTIFPRSVQDGSVSRRDPPDAGDRLQDLSAIYRAHQDYVARVLHHCGLDAGLIDDALQDVFLVVHRRLADFDGRTSIRNWLYGIARRVVSDYRRGKRRGNRRLVLVADDETLAHTEPHGSRVEAGHVVEQFLQRLDEDKRRVFLLAELEGMTAAEIGELEGLNINTVYARLRAARLAFERTLACHLARQKREEPWTG